MQNCTYTHSKYSAIAPISPGVLALLHLVSTGCVAGPIPSSGQQIPLLCYVHSAEPKGRCKAALSWPDLCTPASSDSLLCGMCQAVLWTHLVSCRLPTMETNEIYVMVMQCHHSSITFPLVYLLSLVVTVLLAPDGMWHQCQWKCSIQL